LRQQRIETKSIEEGKMVQKRFLQRGRERMLCWVLLLLAGAALMMPGSAEAA
jgi:hypothetical protein